MDSIPVVLLSFVAFGGMIRRVWCITREGLFLDLQVGAKEIRRNANSWRCRSVFFSKLSTHPRPRRIALGGVLLSGLALFGCASGGTSNPFTESSARDYYQLRVESRSTYDVSIYVDLGQRRELLATIRPRSIEFLEFQYPLGRPLRIELESMVGERYRIPPGSAQGGGRVDLIIQNNIRRSAFIRR